jgi:flagellar biosynthesis/type III secretory pathway chaperone
MSALSPVGDAAPNDLLAEQLRQMIAVLEQERQALASLDLEAITLAYTQKQMLCDVWSPDDQSGSRASSRASSGASSGGTSGGGNPAEAPVNPAALTEECRALIASARRMNQVNLTVRNLMASNVAARLDALTDRASTYELDLAANT